MSSVADAVERVRWLVPPAGSTLAPEDAVRAVAITAYEESWRWYIQNRRALEANLQDGFPVPVLTRSKADHLESLWTQYLAHMIDPSARHGLGDKLGPRLFELVTNKARPVGRLVVRTEVGLDPSECCQKTRGNYLDILITDDEHAVAIEHKINAGQSDWTCDVCRRTKRQLGEYRMALRGKGDRALALIGDRKVFLRYLTPGGGSPGTVDSNEAKDRPEGEEWYPVAHRTVAACLSTALNSPLASSERFSLIALLMDLNGTRLGDWAGRIDLATRIVVGAIHDHRLLTMAEVAGLHDAVSSDPVLGRIVCGSLKFGPPEGES